MKSTKISTVFLKRGNRNAKRTETNNARREANCNDATALERSVEKLLGVKRDLNQIYSRKHSPLCHNTAPNIKFKASKALYFDRFRAISLLQFFFGFFRLFSLVCCSVLSFRVSLTLFGCLGAGRWRGETVPWLWPFLDIQIFILPYSI